jgi:hypothetical protein
VGKSPRISVELGKNCEQIHHIGNKQKTKRRISEKLKGKKHGETWGTFWRSVEQIGDLLDNG